MKHLTALAVAAALLLPSVAQADPIDRFGLVVGTHNPTPGLSYAAVRTQHLDLDALLVTGTSERSHEQYAQRHYHVGIGLFTPVVGNVSFGIESIDKGRSFGRIQYAISVRL